MPRPPVRSLLALLGGVVALLAVWARRTRVQPPMPAVPARTERTVTTHDGTRLHAGIGGRDDADLTVVFVHGFLARSAEFDPQWEALQGRVRTVRYDHRGHGKSSRSRRAADIDTLARDLSKVLDELVPRGPVVLVGHSMGGMTVLALAQQQPELFRTRVRGVLLLATGAGHYIPGHPFENAARFLARRHVFAPVLLLLRLLAPLHERLRPRNTALMRRTTRALLFGRDDATDPLVRQVHQMLEEPPLSSAAALHGALLRHDKVDALQVLRAIPVTILAGEDDRLTRVEHSYAMARDLPHAELQVLPGTGHALNRSRPGVVNDALLRLLDRVRVDYAA
jgi:pimeloyl-ACP methyl ester carboxylesterase